MIVVVMSVLLFFFQAEDGIRDLVRSRGLGDVYKRQKVSSIHLFPDPTRGSGLFEGIRSVTCAVQ